ncbi:GroES family chaperonin [Isoptericola cucumis]|uniref:10 kDa chaperonin n=1 Tax=Isoptericola cucumis TaxID=1776856 RepID=A0ABQ2B8C8_9MICO|nr:10 kDa chaperonin [Isoptericola cucumis]
MTPAAPATGPAASGPSSGSSPDAPLPIRMLHDRLLVEPEVDSAERQSTAGLVIPATASGPKRLAWAAVVAKGEHVRQVAVGDRVLYDPEDRAEVDLGGTDYVLLRERDVHGVAETTQEPGATGLYL